MLSDIMNRVRAHSYPQLLQSNNLEQEKNSSVEEDGCKKPERVALLDDVKIQKQQASKAELRRCNTDLRRGALPKDTKKPQDPIAEENQKLHRALTASTAARKSLEKMFSSLGKEKEIIAAELAKKVREINDTEELLADLRAQNEKLLDKVKACATEHRAKKGGADGAGEAQGGHAALQERNKLLSEQLLKSLDSYRSTKRRLKDAQEENKRITRKVVEVAGEATSGIDKIRGIRERINVENEEGVEIKEELSEFERLLRGMKNKLLGN
ncbi:uncharacterized protein [Typha latifolia]|uniref:uncharacterized protein isoform X1 n=1 Tax=Typha latifolia TaxID=4733 RepID=UPI003C2E57B0